MQLFLITNCTNSKRVKPEPKLEINTFEDCSIQEAAREWILNSTSISKKIVASQLYKGQGWANAMKSLENALLVSKAELLISSAGHGLISHTDSISPYACTFNRNSGDSIYRFLHESESEKPSIWWDMIYKNKAFSKEAFFLISLPTQYMIAMKNTIESIIKSNADKVVLLSYGKAKSLFPENTIRIDSRINEIIPGVMSSVNQRMLNFTTKLISNTGIKPNVKSLKTAIETQLSGIKHKKITEKNIQLTDTEISAAIREFIANNKISSATQGLRMLRSKGFACSQERFHRLFATTKGLDSYE